MERIDIKSIGELKAALKQHKPIKVFVWCNCYVEDGEYIETSKSKLLRSIGADVPNDGAHGGPHDHTRFTAHIADDALYVS